MPYHSLSITDPSKKKHTLHVRKEVTLLPTQEEGRFSSCPATSPANGKCCSSANEKLLSPWTLIFLQWIFIFLLLMTSLSHPPFYKSLPFYITPWSISLPGRWDAAIFMNHLIKSIRSSNLLRWSNSCLPAVIFCTCKGLRQCEVYLIHCE